MSSSIRLFLFLALITLFVAAPASARQIAGQVLDADGQPVAGATVFVDMTTLQTISDADGRFNMPTPAHYSFEVVAIADGLQATGVRTNQEDCRNMDIIMSAPFEAVGDPLDDDMLSFFKLAAFSYTRFARDIEIESADVLRHAFDDAMNVITIESTGPFIFSNPALGYKITIHDFRMGGNAITYGWEGYTLFEPMTPEKRKTRKTGLKTARPHSRDPDAISSHH